MAIRIKQETLELSEFQHILNMGLGRAILYLKRHSASPYRDAILYACLNVTSYDRQVEGTRSDYVWEVLQASGEPEFYRAPILEALQTAEASSDDDYRLSHLFALALHFAQAGDNKASETIHQKFAENVRAGLLTGDFALIALDRIAGIASIVSQVEAAGFLEKFDWELENLIREAEDEFGAATTWAALDALEADEPLRSFLAQIRIPSKPPVRVPPNTNEQEIRSVLDDGKSLPSGWRDWVASAPNEIINSFAAEVLTEQNPQRLLKLIQMFGKRDFPLTLNRLIQLAEYGDARIEYDRTAVFAINALQRITHPDVRALALRMIANDNRVGRAVGLLQKNFEPGDWTIIAELSKRSLNDEEYHSLGWSARNVFEQHPLPEAAETFINLYERGVCSQCRERNVEILAQLHLLPEWMREECQYDSNFNLREQARAGFSGIEA